jgi:cytochrome c oxidase cbb3-type subunit 3/ubiquinol-cytochrome c reductase cytochrome c subunit
VTLHAWTLGCCLLLACGLIGCDGLPGRPDEADRYQHPAEITDFAALYGTNCSGCHGAEGRLGPARPLNDPVYLALVDRARVQEIVARGIPETSMPAFATSAGGTLTDAQVGLIADGLFDSWQDASKLAGAPLPPYRGTGGNAARGARVYASFCASCHGADGAGGKAGGSIVDPSFLSLVSDQMLRNSVIAGRPDLGMPDWRKLGDRAMNADEISDVVAWMTAKRVLAPLAQD